jgi:hypothetical protein
LGGLFSSLGRSKKEHSEEK